MGKVRGGGCDRGRRRCGGIGAVGAFRLQPAEPEGPGHRVGFGVPRPRRRPGRSGLHHRHPRGESGGGRCGRCPPGRCSGGRGRRHAVQLRAGGSGGETRDHRRSGDLHGAGPRTPAIQFDRPIAAPRRPGHPGPSTRHCRGQGSGRLVGGCRTPAGEPRRYRPGRRDAGISGGTAAGQPAGRNRTPDGRPVGVPGDLRQPAGRAPPAMADARRACQGRNPPL